MTIKTTPAPDQPSADALTPAPLTSAHSVIPVSMSWLIRADMPDVLEIEAYSKQDHPWNQDTFTTILRDRSAIGLVARQSDPSLPANATPTGKVLGFCVYLLEKQSLHVLNLSVHCDYRFFGIGRQIIDKLKSKLLPKRRILTVPVPERNLGMQIFLRQCGFRARGILNHPASSDVRYAFEYRIHADSDCSGTGLPPQQDRKEK